ncbi:hypothetical protein F5Y16DRAFT_410869 [Xylariaceae sp. FL0255]|nr:hypothetical protein F5Y16DRAFT_410869 [Xylariaceae sp. FL0255]
MPPRLPHPTRGLPDDYIPPTQPPTARRPELRKAQLIRTYTALLRSTPLILFFQHNNLTAVEWAAVRRELRAALAQVPLPATLADGSVPVDITPTIEIQVLRTRMFTVASKIVEYFKPEAEAFKEKSNTYTHDLSTSAYEASKNATVQEDDMFSQLAPLLTGPVAAVTFPSVSPAHLAAVLKVLSPSSPAFPAPTRKKNPGYWDPTAQAGLQKLLMIGGRIEGKAFDTDGVKWVGGIEGGLDGLRAQLVHMLQSAGMGLTTALEGHSKGNSPTHFLKKKKKMDFAPYQSSPPEHNRPFSPPQNGTASSPTTSPRASTEYTYHIRRPFSPPNPNLNANAARSPPPLQHPQPQRSWNNNNVAATSGYGYGYADEGGFNNHDNTGGGLGGFGGGGGGGRGQEFTSHRDEFDTSLGLRLDYEAVLAYVGFPPLGAIVLLILERSSDYVRFHAWQSSLVFTALFILHLIFSWSTFFSWVIAIGDVALIGYLALHAYRDADTLDRFEVPVFGGIASHILDDE